MVVKSRPPSDSKIKERFEDAEALLFASSQTLITVLRARSFSEAARVLGVRQSTISRQVRALEDRLGVSLFERCAAGTRATDAGLRVAARLEQISALARRAVQEARDLGEARSGRLRLGFVGSFATSPAADILARYRRLQPGVRLQLTELGATELSRQVINRELDCAWVASWRSPSPDLVCEVLWKEPLYLAVPTTRRTAETVLWSELSNQVLLARPGAELDLLYSALQQAGVARPDVQFHDCSRESLMALVAQGDGVAIMTESFARLGRSGVRFARIDEPGAEVAMCVMYRRDRDNPPLRRLLAITRGWLGENHDKLPPLVL